ncbi:methyltransferase family protein [Aliiruegeria haliotis]|uniref:Methyltransferase family protein n=1 Tax=Aliiruegeria haliotis TaxID=1280846 RepID=A0A2T0RZ34_9RHOB|nr:class I SAM-dependent methyltransferase [Aliiruegeria haliotis]PRY26446.1 methyltransferase family protein [Aliiruegeria haliotis]
MQYETAARILRLFSANSATRQLYEWLGRARGLVGRDQDINWKYFWRTPMLLEALRRHGILTPGMRALEIGTGWFHWEALMLRNEVPCEVTLYDVVDKRRPTRMQRFLQQLSDSEVRERLGLENADGAALMQQAAAAASPAELYEMLGFSYAADPSGKMPGLPDAAYDLLVSSDVGEHLIRDHIPDILRRWFEVTRPGGYGYHLIVLVDHLRIYAKDAHEKQYLTYDRQEFLGRINNAVQYVNTLQVPEYREAFETAGFEILEMTPVGTCDLDRIDVHPSWSDFSAEDLSCTVLQVVVRRPLQP